MQRLIWRQSKALPRMVADSLDALALDGGSRRVVRPDEQTLYFLNRHQLTLIAGVAEFRGANDARLGRLRKACDEALGLLTAAGIDAVLLKGFARADEYLPDTSARMHYDVDLYCPHQAHAARAVLEQAGYRSMGKEDRAGTGHLAPLVRPAPWMWHGDFFDIDTPVAIELHTALWTASLGMRVQGLDGFWERRERCGQHLTLSRHDTLAYRCLHCLRHILRGDTRAAQVFEVAWFLNRNAADDDFWLEWQKLYTSEFRRLQVVVFGIARRWFGCALSGAAASEIAKLPNGLLDWLQRDAAAPLESFFVANKRDLVLHWQLADSPRARWRIARSRLLPRPPARPQWESRAAYWKRLLQRGRFHLSALRSVFSGL